MGLPSSSPSILSKHVSSSFGFLIDGEGTEETEAVIDELTSSSDERARLTPTTEVMAGLAAGWIGGGSSVSGASRRGVAAGSSARGTASGSGAAGVACSCCSFGI